MTFLVMLDLIPQRTSRELPLIVGDTPKLYATRGLLLAVVVPMSLRLAFPSYDAGQRFGRIAFAHTDLNGFADNQGTTRISRRAVGDLLD